VDSVTTFTQDYLSIQIKQ